jgi:hypothetical protein
MSYQNISNTGVDDTRGGTRPGGGNGKLSYDPYSRNRR